MKLYYSY